MLPRALPKMLMIAPVSGPKLKPAMTPTTEVGIPGTAHITAVNTIKSIDAKVPCERICASSSALLALGFKIIGCLSDILNTTDSPLPVSE